MRISIFGNTNNYPYTLALGLRKLGVDVRLVVNSRETLHRLESKDPRMRRKWPDWVMDASDISEDEFVCESPRICNVLNVLWSECDGAILNQIGPSLSQHLSSPCLGLLTGSDLLYYADYASGQLRQESWDESFRRSPGGLLAQRQWEKFVERQRLGIKSATAISYIWPGLIPKGDDLLDEIGVPVARRFCVYMADTDALKYSTPANRSHLRVFNGARVLWKKPLPAGLETQDDKGTDILIAGFAEFLKRGGRGELRMVRKGQHVQETEQLIEEFGIRKSVTWLKEMPLHKFHDEMKAADVVCDQLGPSFPALVANEAMALGRPALANFRPEIIQAQFQDPMPVCHAATAEEVADQLLRLHRSPRFRLDIGLEARRFAEKWLSPSANAQKCIEKLGLTSKLPRISG